MKQETFSRGPAIDTERCVVNARGQFNLILYAAARARELKQQYKNRHEYDHPSATVTALLEIQQGQIDATRNPLSTTSRR
jgi:DNA-directed RNA polymerase subunit K/omega